MIDPDEEAVYALLGDDVAGLHCPPITLPPVHVTTDCIVQRLVRYDRDERDGLRDNETFHLGPMTRAEAEALVRDLDGAAKPIVVHIRSELHRVLA